MVSLENSSAFSRQLERFEELGYTSLHILVDRDGVILPKKALLSLSSLAAVRNVEEMEARVNYLPVNQVLLSFLGMAAKAGVEIEPASRTNWLHSPERNSLLELLHLRGNEIIEGLRGSSTEEEDLSQSAEARPFFVFITDDFRPGDEILEYLWTEIRRNNPGFDPQADFLVLNVPSFNRDEDRWMDGRFQPIFWASLDQAINAIDQGGGWL